MLQALRDLADPAEGVYNATALLGDRLLYIQSMLDKYQKLPNRGGTQAVAALVSGSPDRDEANVPLTTALTEKFTSMIGQFAVSKDGEADEKSSREQPGEVSHFSSCTTRTSLYLYVCHVGCSNAFCSSSSCQPCCLAACIMRSAQSSMLPSAMPASSCLTAWECCAQVGLDTRKEATRKDTERSLVLSELETRRNAERDGRPELVSANILASRKLASQGATPAVSNSFKVLSPVSFLAPFNSRPAPSSIQSYHGDVRQIRRDDLHYHRGVISNPANLPSTYGITHKFRRGWDGPVLSHRSTAVATHEVDAAGAVQRLPSHVTSSIVEKPRSLGRILGSGRGRDGKQLREPELKIVGQVVTLAT